MLRVEIYSGLVAVSKAMRITTCIVRIKHCITQVQEESGELNL